MKLPPYPEYKPSGVESLGELPENWAVKRGRFCMEVNPRSNRLRALGPDDEVSFVPMEAVGEYGGLQLEQTRAIADVGSGYTEFDDGDVVVAKITPCFENGKGALAVGLVNGAAFGTTELHVLRAPAILERRFLFYFTISRVFRSTGEGEMYGAGGQKRVPPEFCENVQISVPPIDDQRTIADFLDHETARIDTLVAKKRRLIERLKEKRTALISRTVTRGLPPDAARAADLDPQPKLKPSGIDWLGDVPEHWGVRKLGHISTVVRGASPRPAGDPRYFDGDFIPWITVGELTKDPGIYLTSTESMLTEEGAELSRVMREGTLVLTNSGATLGVPKILAITGCANDGVVAFENLRRDSNKLFLYYFLASITANLRDRIKQGSGQPNLNTDIIKSLAAPYPPAAEQQAIAQYLAVETAQTDGIIAKVEAAIERLQEYRTALITAAVTGKIDVRGAVA